MPKSKKPEAIDPKKFTLGQLREMCEAKELQFTDEMSKSELAGLMNSANAIDAEAMANAPEPTPAAPNAEPETEADLARQMREDAAELSKLRKEKAEREAAKDVKANASSSAKVLYVEATVPGDKPALEFYCAHIEGGNRRERTTKATEVVLEDGLLHRIYRVADTPENREIFVSNPYARILAPEEVNMDLLSSLKMADLEERRQASRHKVALAGELRAAGR